MPFNRYKPFRHNRDKDGASDELVVLKWSFGNI